MKVGDLVNNTHALDRSGLGLIVEISKPQLTNPNACPYRVQWINPPPGCPAFSWNSAAWLELIDD
mgnify:CR=1 FL=1